MGQPNLGAPLPLEPSKRWYKVIYPKAGTTLRATILAPTFLGEYLHFDGRSLACTRLPTCPGCKAKLSFKWGGYIAIYSHGLKERAILGLTEKAASDLLPLLERFTTLRGITIEAKRVNPRNGRSRVGIVMLGREKPEDIMAEHPIIDSLNRLWSVNEEWRGLQDTTAQMPAYGAMNVGIPLPAPDQADEPDRPTQGQKERLREVFQNFGSME